MNIQKNNFGLAGFSNYIDSDDSYDYLFNRFKERRAEKREDKQQKRADNKQRKDDRKAERQEKRELSSEKKRLKNELKQTQIDERKSQLSLLNQQGQQPIPAIMPPGNDSSTMIVAGVVGVIAIAGVAYFMLKKKPDVVPLSKAA
jgi:FtsZ-interacting cell division protein YlmF